MKKIDITKLVMKFTHNITTDEVIFRKTKFDGRTLLKQLEDALNEQLE